MKDLPKRPDGVPSSRPKKSVAVGAFLAGLNIMPGDVNRREPSGRQHPRAEVVMVLTCTIASVLVGGVIGGWFFGAVGAVLGVVAGLPLSGLPIALGQAMLKRRRSRNAAAEGSK